MNKIIGKPVRSKRIGVTTVTRKYTQKMRTST